MTRGIRAIQRNTTFRLELDFGVGKLTALSIYLDIGPIIFKQSSQ